MIIYAGRDNDGKIVVDVDRLSPNFCTSQRLGFGRAALDPRAAERLGHDLLALAYDHEANRAAYGDASDTEDHDRAVDQALADGAGLGTTWVGPSEAFDPDDPLQNDNHPENDASGEPDFGG